MSEGMCDFVIDSDYDGDEASFFSEKWVTARKPHLCAECKLPIAKGEKYRRVAGKWEGDLDTFHFCASCEDIAHEFMDGARCFGILWDEMQSNWEAGAPLQACLNRLESAAAKAHMVTMWKRWKGLDAAEVASALSPECSEKGQDS